MKKLRLAPATVAVMSVSALVASLPALAAVQPLSSPTHELASFGFWKALDCVVAVSAFVAGNTYLVLKIKRFGGVVKFARSLWKAKSAEERAKVVARAIGYVAGTGAVVKACTP